MVVLLHQNPTYLIRQKIVKSGRDLPNLMRSLLDLVRSPIKWIGSFPIEDEEEYIKSGKSIFKGNFVQKVIF